MRTQGDTEGLSEAVKTLAGRPDGKISAIALNREQTGAGLAQAKEAVEAYLAGPTELRR